MNAPLIQTVAAINYLPVALTLEDSVRRHLPEARFSILVTDASSALLDRLRETLGSRAELIGCHDLDYPLLATLRDHYSVLEFSSACKILALDYQLRKKNEEACFFIDPDMWATGDFTAPALSLNKDIVATLHARSPFPKDGQLPYETEIAVSGAINGGFLFMKRSDRSLEALDWLKSKIPGEWFVAPAFGLYADQQWLSFLPQYFQDCTGLLTHPGVNIAYWNLHERPLCKTGLSLTAAGRSALLFHFSGFSTSQPLKLSRHASRRFDPTTEDTLSNILPLYAASIDTQKQNLDKAGFVRGDLGFAKGSLPSRMKRARKMFGAHHFLTAGPVGFFAKLGAYIDRLRG